MFLLLHVVLAPSLGCIQLATVLSWEVQAVHSGWAPQCLFPVVFHCQWSSPSRCTAEWQDSSGKGKQKLPVLLCLSPEVPEWQLQSLPRSWGRGGRHRPCHFESCMLARDGMVVEADLGDYTKVPLPHSRFLSVKLKAWSQGLLLETPTSGSQILFLDLILILLVFNPHFGGQMFFIKN